MLSWHENRLENIIFPHGTKQLATISVLPRSVGCPDYAGTQHKVSSRGRVRFSYAVPVHKHNVKKIPLVCTIPGVKLVHCSWYCISSRLGVGVLFFPRTTTPHGLALLACTGQRWTQH